MHLQIQVISFLLQKQFTYTIARIYSKPSTFYPNYKRISFLFIIFDLFTFTNQLERK